MPETCGSEKPRRVESFLQCDETAGTDRMAHGKRTRKKAYEVILISLCSRMVRPEGFELPTYRFVACCSIQLSYERSVRKNTSRS